MKRLLFLLLFLTSPIYAQNILQGFSTASITTSTATCNQLNSTGCVVLPLFNSPSGASITVSGTFSGSLFFEATADGVNYAPISATPSAGGSAVTGTTSTGMWIISLTGLTQVRVRSASIASGTAVVTIQVTKSSGSGGSGGGGSGSGTVLGQAAGVIPLATAATAIGAQSHLDDGNTTAGTITSTEPIAVVTGGGTAGGYVCGQGTANGHATANQITLECPASVTAYELVLPGTSATGVVHRTNSSNVDTESISSVVSADLNITGTTCTNQVVSAISSAAAGTCHTIVGGDMASSTVTATQLAAQYSKGSCTELWGGSGTSFALTSGDDAIANNSCYNDSGVTRTITAVKCRSNNGSNTTTVNPTFGAAGTGTTILSGALTCGSSLAYSSTGTVSNASWTTGTGITPAMSGTLTGTSIAMIVEFTF